MISFKQAHIGHNKTLLAIESLSLAKGEVYILAGRNGAGKSTLLKTLTKEVSLIAGNISLNETELNGIRPNDISKHLAFVRSSFPNVDYLKVLDFVALGRTPFTNALGRLTSNDLKIVAEAIDALNINELADKFTSELSDGERQLTAIARAIAQETSIILLDEPTAFLDYSNKMRVLELLKRIAQEMNKCIVMSSHDIDLSIDSNCPFLVLSEAGIQLLETPVSKQQVLELAF